MSDTVAQKPTADASMPAVAPQHIVTCYVDAHPPRFGRDGKLYGWGDFYCSAQPDQVYRYVRLEYYNPRTGQWYPVAQNSSTVPFAGESPMASIKACAQNSPSTLWRTRVYQRGFHGTWDEDKKVSSTFRGYCM
ncbi:hypothetical protein ACWDWO_00615 [Actinopolymorpha singaporensis]|nr:hypothetical protein [Actinopolymorpha singaporensis]